MIQLPLNVGINQVACFENFIGNAELITTLKQSINDQTNQFIYFSGKGKTHLLEASCHYTDLQNQTCSYVPLSALNSLDTLIFDTLESLFLVCIDDIHLIKNHIHWQEALFNFYNRARQSGTLLFVTGNQPPTLLGLELADLTSRLSWGPIFNLDKLSDAQKIKLLQLKANNRGLDLPKAVANYILNHYQRDLSLLDDLIETLDKASLIEKRKLTIHFIKQYIT
jgi:DnaA-homolog protein